MNIEDAKQQWSEWMANSIAFADELGADAVANNESILHAALPMLDFVTDLDAYMADLSEQLTLFDYGLDFSSLDNTVPIVILDDGTQMTYEAYALSLEGSDAFAGMEPPYEALNPLDERAEVVGVEEMSHLHV